VKEGSGTKVARSRLPLQPVLDLWKEEQPAEQKRAAHPGHV
jgi:hypothetical protein